MRLYRISTYPLSYVDLIIFQVPSLTYYFPATTSSLLRSRGRIDGAVPLLQPQEIPQPLLDLLHRLLCVFRSFRSGNDIRTSGKLLLRRTHSSPLTCTVARRDSTTALMRPSCCSESFPPCCWPVLFYRSTGRFISSARSRVSSALKNSSLVPVRLKRLDLRDLDDFYGRRHARRRVLHSQSGV